MQVVVGVDPADAIKVAADPLAGVDRVVAVVAVALVPGGRRGRRDGPTDLCTGAGVLEPVWKLSSVLLDQHG